MHTCTHAHVDTRAQNKSGLCWWLNTLDSEFVCATRIHTYTHTHIHSKATRLFLELKQHPSLIHMHTYTCVYICAKYIMNILLTEYAGCTACLRHTHTHIHTCTHIHTYTYTHIHTFTYTQIHTHTHTHVHIYTLTHLHTYIYTHIHTYTYAHIHTYTYTHVRHYTYTHIYTYTYTHIHICINMHTYICVDFVQKTRHEYDDGDS